MIEIERSHTHPMPIFTVPTATDGALTFSACPGRRQPRPKPPHFYERDLGIDLERIRATGATVLVSLIEYVEIRRYSLAKTAPELGGRVRACGLDWVHLPIPDMRPPDARFEQAWPAAWPGLKARLQRGEGVHVHCLAGNGRSGTVACRILVELGIPAARALILVRAARETAVETHGQEAYVLALSCPD